MATASNTFRLMARLTADERAVLEARYDGEIPEEAVLALLSKHPMEDERAVMRARSLRMWGGAKQWLRKGNALAAEYRLAGNPEAARHIRHQYRDIARQCLEERRGLRDALSATQRQAAE
jgi:hypothetical protein